MSRRGTLEATLKVSSRTAPGQVFALIHLEASSPNVLTALPVDSLAGMPELKHCPVRLEKLSGAG